MKMTEIPKEETNWKNFIVTFNLLPKLPHNHNNIKISGTFWLLPSLKEIQETTNCMWK